MRKIKYAPNTNKRVHAQIQKVEASKGKETIKECFTFVSDDGPTRFVQAMIDSGYCMTEELVDLVKSRSNYETELDKILHPEKYETECYDLGALLIGVRGRLL